MLYVAPSVSVWVDWNHLWSIIDVDISRVSLILSFRTKHRIHGSDPPDIQHCLPVTYASASGQIAMIFWYDLRVNFIGTNACNTWISAPAVHEWVVCLIAILFIRNSTCQRKHLIITWTARLRLHAWMIIRIAVTMRMRTAWTFGAMMLRMHVLTSKAFYKSHDEALAASAAGVHAKTYDTHRVPYYQQ